MKDIPSHFDPAESRSSRQWHMREGIQKWVGIDKHKEGASGLRDVQCIKYRSTISNLVP